jgi:hypothetical protein
MLARDVLLAEAAFGREKVHWDRAGRWLQIDHMPVASPRFGLSLLETYVIIMVPPDYGDRAGLGAGLEEFYVHRDLRIRQDGSWVEIPHTYLQVDRRGGAATKLQHRYACVHIDWHPQRDNVFTSLKLLRLMLSDPWRFEQIGARH